MTQTTQEFKGLRPMLSRLCRHRGSSFVGIVLIAFALSLTVGGCHKKARPSGKKSDGISFGATTAKTDGKTKTVYAGNTRTTGEIEKIYWVAGDVITVACPQDYGGVFVADYSLTPQSDQTKADVAPVSNDLYWNHSESTHYFYGQYPAKSSISDVAAKSSTSLTKAGVFNGYIPDDQLTLIAGKSTIAATGSDPEIKVYAPVMQNLPMWAGTSADRLGNVSLIFRPAATAFEFTLKGEELTEEIEVVSIELTSVKETSLPSCALSGPFTGKIAQGGASISYKSADGGNIPAATATNNKVSVALDSDAKVTTGKAVRATLFTLPASNISGKENTITDIKLTVYMKQGSNTLIRHLYLKDKTTMAMKEFDCTKKYLITLSVPSFKHCSFSVVIVDPVDPKASDITTRNADVELFDDSDYGDILLW